MNAFDELLDEPIAAHDIDRLRTENIRLRELVVHLSKLVLRNVVAPGLSASNAMAPVRRRR